MPEKAKSLAQPVTEALLVSSGASIVLLVTRYLASSSMRFWFLAWNLVLAWLPLIFAWYLSQGLKTRRWASWQNIGFTLLWFSLLPNSFYLVSDFVHLRNTGEVSMMFDAVMLMSFAWNGLVLGFLSVLVVHRELIKRLPQKAVLTSLGVLFLLCSFAIYLGRYLGWNSWDILLSPAGIIFDLSDRIIKPTSFPNTFTTTTMFFVLLTSTYYTFYNLIRVLQVKPEQ